MTDFGRKAGLGDMLKSVYDPNADGVLAVAQTEADMKKSVYDPNADGVLAVAQTEADMKKSVYDTDNDGKADALDEHASSHQDGGTDEIDVTGLVGTAPGAMLGDGTAGRVLRKVSITIDNGSNASTIKCTVTSMWNGDAIAEQDNIGKDATTGHFHLSANGQALTILNSGLTGDALDGTVSLYYNASLTALLVSAMKTADGLVLNHIGLLDGVGKDLTALVDTGIIIPHILYITDA